MRNFIYPVAVPFLRLYWRWVKPKTFGVKVIIKHPKSNQVLLVQHSYGDTNIWHLPGGGTNPIRESAEWLSPIRINAKQSYIITQFALKKYQV